MKIVYICERPYNLYRTLLKAVNSNDDMDLVITDNIKGMDLMCDVLRKSGLFKNVFFFNDLKHKTFSYYVLAEKPFSADSIADIIRIPVSIFFMILGLIDYMISQRKARKAKLPDGLDFDIYDEIHITDCTSILNFYVYRKKYDNIVYVEHSKGGLQGDTPRLAMVLYLLVKLRIIYGIRGTCRYISAVEVSENFGLTWEVKNKEIREIPIGRLFDEVSPEKREFIYKLYAKAYKLDFPSDSVIDVYLATFLPDELKTSLHLCEEAIRRHMSDAEHIIIKPHPSSSADYLIIPKSCPKAVVLPSSFSAEVFGLTESLKIRKLIHFGTSAIEVFQSVEEIIELDEAFVDECRSKAPSGRI